MPGAEQATLDEIAGGEFEDAGTSTDNRKPVLGWECRFFNAAEKGGPLNPIIVLSRTLRRAALKAENWCEEEYGVGDWHLISVSYREDVIP